MPPGPRNSGLYLARYKRFSNFSDRNGGPFFPQNWLSTCSETRGALAILLPRLLLSMSLSTAGVAQLVEHLICNQRVGGSNPSASSTRFFGEGVRRIVSGE